MKVNSRISFQRAEEDCKAFHSESHLPSIHSLSELLLVANKAKMLGHGFLSNSGMLLGGKMVGGNVKWIDGSPTDFTFWENGYPPVNYRECVAVFHHLGWKDVKCPDEEDKEEAVFVCKMHMLIVHDGHPRIQWIIFIIFVMIVVVFITGITVRYSHTILNSLISYTNRSISLTNYNHTPDIGIVDLTSVIRK